MSSFTDTETPNYAKDLRDIRILSFKSHRKALLYAGANPPEFDNWKLAASFAQAQKMIPIEATEGGIYLSYPNRAVDLKYTRDEIKRIWGKASVKYCVNIEGSVKTFVCGANDTSIFRRKEIHAMMRSKSVEEINGVPHTVYARLRREKLARLNDEKRVPQNMRHKRAITAIFRKLALAEIRQDVAVAQEADIPSILKRVGHLRAQHRRELAQTPRPAEMEKLVASLSAQEEMAAANPHLHVLIFVHHRAMQKAAHIG